MRETRRKFLKILVVSLIIAMVGGTFSCYAVPKSALKVPTIEWNNPSDIQEGTALSSVQLNAVAKYNGTVVSGRYTYSPSINTILTSGNSQPLSVVFKPTSTRYKSVSKTVYINVLPKEIIKVNPIITWNNPTSIDYGTALTETQLNATSNVEGTFVYTPSLNTLLDVGIHTLNVDFIPTDTIHYNNVSKTVNIIVNNVVVPTNELNVKDFGAKGDGITDDTIAINNAIIKASTTTNKVYIPAGTYLINATIGIQISNNTSLYLDENATLKAIPTSSGSYKIISLWKKNNITITGGHIVGERYEHLGTDGQWGFGIAMYGCENITISNMTIQDCWGDGIYVGSADDGVSNPTSIYINKNIIIDNIYVKDCRRDNISIITVDGLLVKNCTLEHANGHAPECGINFEPNYPQLEKNINVTIENLIAKDNMLYGIQFGSFMYMYQMPVDIEIINYQSINNQYEFGPWNSYYNDKIIIR